MNSIRTLCDDHDLTSHLPPYLISNYFLGLLRIKPALLSLKETVMHNGKVLTEAEDVNVEKELTQTVVPAIIKSVQK
jgi:hypothetical protein